MKFANPKRGNWTQVSNEILDSEVLSCFAKIIWIFLWSKPDGWIIRVNHIAKKLKISKDKVRRSLKELEECGYIVKIEVREQGRFFGYRIDMFETPTGNSAFTPHYAPNKQQQQQRLPETENAPGTEVTKPEESEAALPHIEKSDIDLPRVEKPDAGFPNAVFPNINKNNSSNIDINQNSYQSIFMSHIDTEERLKDKIHFESLSSQYGRYAIQNIVDIILGALLSTNSTIEISKNRTVSAEYFHSQMRKLSFDHIDYIFRRMEIVKPRVVNARSYFLEAILRATEALDLSYAFGDDESL